MTDEVHASACALQCKFETVWHMARMGILFEAGSVSSLAAVGNGTF